MAIGEISVEELVGVLADGAVLFDVREPDEYDDGHVSGAILIPLGEVPTRVQEFGDKAPIYLICRSGGRSMQAAKFLARNGRDTVNIAGGTLAWIALGYDVVTGPDPR